MSVMCLSFTVITSTTVVSMSSFLDDDIKNKNFSDHGFFFLNFLNLKKNSS